MDVSDIHTKDKVLKFVKMQGLGNDYIYFDFRASSIDETLMPLYAVRFSDRHFGIGGDGVVYILGSETADAKMRMFNADGTEGMMCGNAIRCIARYLFEHGVKKDVITLETAVGIKTLWIDSIRGEVKSITADMGTPSFLPEDIGLDANKTFIDSEIEIEGKKYRATCLSMGNPHCVIFSEDLGDEVFEEVSKIQMLPMFANGVNVELVRVDSDGLTMRVCERGSGETLACGTGACAACVSAHKAGYADASKGIAVKMRGGTLIVRYNGGSVKVTGAAEEVFRGEITI